MNVEYKLGKCEGRISNNLEHFKGYFKILANL